MTFNEADTVRDTGGRFADKRGLPSEVSLRSDSAPATRRDMRPVTDVFKLPRGGVAKNERLTPSDTVRIRSFLDRHDIVFAEMGKKQSEKKAEDAESGAYGTADQAIADVVLAARAYERDNRVGEEEHAIARELFGDEYQSIVNPKRSFWEQVRGF